MHLLQGGSRVPKGLFDHSLQQAVRELFTLRPSSVGGGGGEIAKDYGMLECKGPPVLLNVGRCYV